MMPMTDSYVLVQSALNSVYQHSIDNKSELLKSTTAHCFCCKVSFAAASVVDYCVSGR